MDIVVRPLARSDAEACDAIVRALPDWFGLESGILEAARAVRGQDGLACELPGEPGSVGGFLTWIRPFPESAEITWMAVRPDARRHGHGRALVEALCERLTAEGVRLLLVKTFGPSGESEEYAQTRAFYLSMGFLPLQELTEVWGPENPCLFLVRPL
jgi:GNAT superfamily N-acetyltransferase